MTFLGFDVQPDIDHLIVTNSAPIRTQSGQQVEAGGTDKRYGWRFQLGPDPDFPYIVTTVMAHFNRMGYTTAFDFEPPQPPGVDDPPSTTVITGDADMYGTVPNTVDIGAYVQVTGQRPVYQVAHGRRLEPRLFHDGAAIAATLNAKVVYSIDNRMERYRQTPSAFTSMTIELVESR